MATDLKQLQDITATQCGDGGFSHPLDEREDLKIHRLIPIHDWIWIKNFVEGISTHTESPIGHPTLDSVFCQKDHTINEQLTKLHSLQKTDPRVQILIDTYLPCCAPLSHPRPCNIPLHYYRLLPDDAPQFANLPDLGNMVRQWITSAMQKSRNKPAPNEESKWLTRVAASLFRFSSKQRCFTDPASPPPDLASVAILLNLLLASMLGLYPNCRRPAWDARVNIYARIHALLTASPQEQVEFTRQNHTLMMAALGEYICRAPHHHMPVEAQIIAEMFGRDGHLQGVWSRFDSFRQEIDDGKESWEHWSNAIKPVVQSLVRGGRAIRPEQKCEESAARATPMLNNMQQMLDTPVLTQYAVHKCMPAQIEAEYRLLLEDATLSRPTIHEKMSVSYLPLGITNIQINCLAVIAQQCESRAAGCRKKLVCIQCTMANRRTECRLMAAADLPQSVVCAHHMTPLIAVDMIGKVLRLGNQQFIFAPCCCTVQPYNGDSHHLWRSTWEGLHPGPCMHSHRTKKAGTYIPPRCFICSSPGVLTKFPKILDHVAYKIKAVYTCPRHTPSPDQMLYVTNISQLAQLANMREANKKRQRRT